MRKQLLVLAAFSAVGLLVGQALAEPAGEARPAGGAGTETRPDRTKAMYDQIITELKLTEKQDAPVRQILDTYRQDMTAWVKQNGPTLRELQGKLGGGRGREGQGAEAKPPTAEERQQAMEKYRELMKQRLDKTENVLKQLKEHLTDEQMTTARRILSPRIAEERGLAALLTSEQLGLSEEQKTKAKEIMDAARKAGEGKEPGEQVRVMREAWNKIIQEVLTADQRTKLEELRRAAGQGIAARMFEGLDLTDDQKAKVQSIMEAARKKGAEAQGAEARREAYTQAQKEIIEKVLTPEQREKYEQRRKEMRERGPGVREGAGAKEAPPKSGDR